MGADSSKLLQTIDVERMPSYFIENPLIDTTSVGILNQSLRQIVGDQKRYQNQRLPFCDFYERFYERLNEVKDVSFNPCTYIEDSNTVQVKSNFLVRLLKLICLLPQNMLSNDMSNPLLLDDESRNELSKFHKRYSPVNLKCYGPVGEALFHTVEQCDEMFTSAVENAWKNAYSLLLRHYIPVALAPRRAKRNSLRHRNLYDLSLDCYSSSSDSTCETPDEDADSPSRSNTSPLERLIAKKRLKKKKTCERERRPSRPSKYVKAQLRAISKLIETKIAFSQRPKTPRYHTVSGVRSRRKSETDETLQLAHHSQTSPSTKKRRSQRHRKTPSMMRLHSLSNNVHDLDQGLYSDLSKRIDIHKNSPQFSRKRQPYYRSDSFSESSSCDPQRRFSAPSVLQIDGFCDAFEFLSTDE